MLNNFPKIALPLSVLFFIASCLIFSFIHTQIDKNNSLAEENNIVWQSEANRRNVLSTMDHSIKVIAPEIMQLETHFAQSSDVVPFLNLIENTARKVGAKAEVLSVDVPVDGKVLSVAMNASGHFEEVYKFLTLLENFPYQLEFISVDVKRSGGFDVPVFKGTRPEWSAFIKINLLSFVK